MKKVLYLILSIVIIMSSCSFEEEYSFDSDWGGKYLATLDMSGIAQMGGEEMEKKELIPEDEIQSLESKINDIKGISNAKVDPNEEDFTIDFSYDFENLEALNLLNSSDLEDGDDESPFGALGKWKMENKGKKKFFMSMMSQDEMTSDIDSEEAKQAGEMLQVTTTLTFPRKVKDVKSDVATKGTNDKQVIVKYTGKDLMDPEKNWIIEVKL